LMASCLTPPRTAPLSLSVSRSAKPAIDHPVAARSYLPARLSSPSLSNSKLKACRCSQQ
jgi:hypothetical protein